jgi:hypothetical protein
MTESDGTVQPMFPNEARLRNLTLVLLFFPPTLETGRINVTLGWIISHLSTVTC